MECNPTKCTQELGLDLNISQSTICCHLKKIEKVNKLSVWYPLTLIEKNKVEKLPISQKYHYKRQKCVLYNDVQRKRRWIDKESPQPTLKVGLHGRKVMLCAWLLFLIHNQTLNVHLYSQLLQRVHGDLQRKHPAPVYGRNVVLLYDNARSYSARITREKIFDLGNILHHIHKTLHKVIFILSVFHKME